MLKIRIKPLEKCEKLGGCNGRLLECDGGSCGRLWEVVGGCGRLWEVVKDGGRLWEVVEG